MLGQYMQELLPLADSTGKVWEVVRAEAHQRDTDVELTIAATLAARLPIRAASYLQGTGEFLGLSLGLAGRTRLFAPLLHDADASTLEQLLGMHVLASERVVEVLSPLPGTRLPIHRDAPAVRRRAVTQAAALAFIRNIELEASHLSDPALLAYAAEAVGALPGQLGDPLGDPADNQRLTARLAVDVSAQPGRAYAFTLGLALPLEHAEPLDALPYERPHETFTRASRRAVVHVAAQLGLYKAIGRKFLSHAHDS